MATNNDITSCVTDSLESIIKEHNETWIVCYVIETLDAQSSCAMMQDASEIKVEVHMESWWVTSCRGGSNEMPERVASQCLDASVCRSLEMRCFAQVVQSRHLRRGHLYL